MGNYFDFKHLLEVWKLPVVFFFLFSLILICICHNVTRTAKDIGHSNVLIPLVADFNIRLLQDMQALRLIDRAFQKCSVL